MRESLYFLLLLDILVAVDVYGSKKIKPADLLAEADLPVGKEVGDDLGDKLDATEKKIQAKFPVAFAKASMIRYFAGPEAGKVYVTLDIVDKGDEARMKFSAPPKGHPTDPDGLVAAWREYEGKAWALLRDKKLVRTGPAKCKSFHCALGFDHPDLAAYEDTFVNGAPKRIDALVEVLDSDADAQNRAAAAFVLAYAGPPEKVVPLLIKALRDESSLVRNNAMRVVAMAQQASPKVIVPLEPLLDTLFFPETTDRNKGLYALSFVAKIDGAKIKKRVLARAGDLLVDMTAMKQPNNRDPAIDILKALSGEDHGTDSAAWRVWVDRTIKPAK